MNAEHLDQAARRAIGAVVIGRNEGERLGKCLTSAVRQASCLLYVDSDSSDGSVALAQSLGIETHALDPTKPLSAARARNEGRERLRLSRHDPQYLQFVDGDCELCDGWLEAAAEFLDSHADVAVVSGRLREKYPDSSVFNLATEFEWDLPAGEARSCGGIAMMRTSAFDQVHGFRTDLIAGEEPELCVRLRAMGWRVWRLDRDMAVHDLAMSRFSQWWKRSLRAGHTFAEGVALHGAPPERHYVREYRSALTWGLCIPLSTLALMALVGPLGALLLTLYPLQVVRLAMLGNRSARANWWRGLFLVVAKFPEVLGVLLFHVRRVLGQRARLIDYK
ncbi:MAG TPA: glycosyltransferase family 2 protein [Steroidobacteraceae bacterium]|nr:glycosyltransferase family 2 protein [Steroidobacteraceae bacterium]